MERWPITLLDEHGRRMWAFDTATDPQKVLHAVTWAWAAKPQDRWKFLPPGTNLCGGDCPFLEGGYCLECHGVAWAALQAARRYVAYREWLTSAPGTKPRLAHQDID